MKHERRAGNLSEPYANVLCWGLSYLTAGDWHPPTPIRWRGIPKRIVVHFDREIVGEGRWNVVRDRLTEAGPETTL